MSRSEPKIRLMLDGAEDVSEPFSSIPKESLTWQVRKRESLALFLKVALG